MCEATESASTEATDQAGSYAVQGMTCTSCAVRVTDAINGVAGVDGTDVNLARGIVTVGGQYDEAQVRSAIIEAGYQVG